MEESDMMMECLDLYLYRGCSETVFGGLFLHFVGIFSKEIRTNLEMYRAQRLFTIIVSGIEKAEMGFPDLSTYLNEVEIDTRLQIKILFQRAILDLGQDDGEIIILSDNGKRDDPFASWQYVNIPEERAVDDTKAVVVFLNLNSRFINIQISRWTTSRIGKESIFSIVKSLVSAQREVELHEQGEFLTRRQCYDVMRETQKGKIETEDKLL
jgi:hypothetical protein